MSRSLKYLVPVFVLGLLTGVGGPLSGAEPPPAVELLQDADLAYKSLDTDQLRYYNNVAEKPAALRSRVVSFAPVDIADVEWARLTLFPDQAVTVKRSQVEQRSANDVTWFGTVPGHATQVILVVHDGYVTGSVADGDDHYSIRPLDRGLSVVVLLDQTAFQDHPEGAYEALEATATPPLKRAESAIRASCSYVDLVVAYTADALSEVADIYGLAQLAVAETNQSFANSNIIHRVRMVHFYGTGYSDSGNMSTDLTRFRTVGDGHMDEVHNLRDAFDGDLAILLTGYYGSACGQASAIYATSSTAFAVAAQNCATGYYTFGHEIGHLHGARHNEQIDPATTPFPYGHGYYHISGSWRTIMAYNCPPYYNCSRVLYWSNPYVTYGGVPMGTVSTNDNHRVLNETCSYVAGFK